MGAAMGWNIVLQLQSATHQACERFALPGLRRPCRVLILCDAPAEPLALDSYCKLRAAIALKAKTGLNCSGPLHPGCITESEPSCVHSLVPIIGQVPLSANMLGTVATWQKKDPDRWTVMPALLPGLTHQKAFGSVLSPISQLQIAPWGGSADRLASIVLQRAVHGERPGVFLSYRRQESSALADQIFDEMTRRGFQVFLDRFSGTTGRLFPQEIAEELAERGVVVVLETLGILKSRWTLWEVAFARIYRLGLLALQLPGAPSIPGVASRLPVVPLSSGRLSNTEAAQAADFIERQHTLAALSRRAFYETLIEAAAKAKGGTTQTAAEGAIEILNGHGASIAIVVPTGRPGRLADARLLVLAAGAISNRPLILAGQHQHLPPQAQTDMSWLATKLNVELLGLVAAYQRVKALV